MDTLVSSTYRDFEAFKLLYESVMKGDEAKVKQLYNTITQTPSRPLTVSHDTLLHIAIYMRHETIAREILNNIKNNIKDDRYVLVARNALGDTVLHEAAATNMTGLAKEMLSLAPELLSMNNNLGETPLFRATHHGQAQMFELLAHEVDQKGQEFRHLHLSRADSTSILHISILAEFFGIPSEYHDHGIESQEDKEVRRQLGLSASEDEDDDLPQTFITRCVQQCSYILEQTLGSALKKINIWIWRVFREGWPIMGDIYNEKKRHESALRLAKLLIKEDTSWEVSRSKEDSGKISLGHFADSPDQSTSDHKLKQGDDKDQEGNIKATSSKNGNAEDLGKTSLKEEKTTTDPDQLAHLGLQITPPNPSTDGVFSVMVYDQDEGDQNKAPESSTETPKEKDPLGGGGLPNPTKEITHNTSTSSSSESTKATEKAKKASSYPPATSLLIATSTGIVEIVNEILRVYPQAVEHVSDMGQNILHVVIKHRKLGIFKCVKKMHLPMSRLVRRIDDNGYTILHHVGVIMYYTGGTLPGPALQLQEELRWFEVNDHPFH
ncbi:Transmembrane protein [Trema orientale]|uniref:Transmembrane protein n=1 Tax=Trema orientale TaxID=63057 RepID=A0A2P5F0K9_TREOI|nr:Transmembrane protein [Trema orientale]